MKIHTIRLTSFGLLIYVITWCCLYEFINSKSSDTDKVLSKLFRALSLIVYLLIPQFFEKHMMQTSVEVNHSFKKTVTGSWAELKTPYIQNFVKAVSEWIVLYARREVLSILRIDNNLTMAFSFNEFIHEMKNIACTTFFS